MITLKKPLLKTLFVKEYGMTGRDGKLEIFEKENGDTLDTFRDFEYESSDASAVLCALELLAKKGYLKLVKL